MLPSIRIKFEPRDLWIGAFWQYKQSVESSAKWFIVYICILPMLPIRLEWAWGWRVKDKAYEAYCQNSWDKNMTAMSYREWKSKQS